MTKILEEDSNRDLVMGSNNQLSILTGIEAVLQACKSAVETQRGELRFDTTRGVPTSQTIWSGVPNQQRFQFYAIDVLRKVPGVTGIKRFNSEIRGGFIAYDAIIETEFGVGEIGSLFDGI